MTDPRGGWGYRSLAGADDDGGEVWNTSAAVSPNNPISPGKDYP